MKTFYISKDNQQMGPFCEAELLTMLENNKLVASDFYYDDSLESWKPLFEFKGLISQYLEKNIKPKAMPAPPVKKVEANTSTSQDHTKSEDKPKSPDQQPPQNWYVLKDKKTFGPYAYTDILKMVSDQLLFEFDQVKSSTDKEWQSISKNVFFAADYIKKIEPTFAIKFEQLKFKRSANRKNYHAPVYAHNNQQIWKGRSLDISKNGCSIVIENSHLLEGSEISLHFSDNNNQSGFNVKGLITNKTAKANLVSDKTPTRYGIEFTSSNQLTQEILDKIA